MRGKRVGLTRCEQISMAHLPQLPAAERRENAEDGEQGRAAAPGLSVLSAL